MDMVRRVDRAMDRILDRLDYKPLPTHGRRLTKAEWEAHGARPRGTCGGVGEQAPADVPLRQRPPACTVRLPARRRPHPEPQRRHRRHLPRRAQPRDVADPSGQPQAHRGPSRWTLTPAGTSALRAARRVGRHRRQRLAQGRVRLRGRSRGTGVQRTIPAPHAPHIIVGYNFHAPSQSPGRNARLILEDIVGWGHSLGYVITDQAYLPGANPMNCSTSCASKKPSPSMRYPVPTSRSARGEGTIQAEANGGAHARRPLAMPATPLTARQVMVDYNKAVAADEANTALSKTERAAREKEHAHCGTRGWSSAQSGSCA